MTLRPTEDKKASPSEEKITQSHSNSSNGNTTSGKNENINSGKNNNYWESFESRVSLLSNKNVRPFLACKQRTTEFRLTFALKNPLLLELQRDLYLWFKHTRHLRILRTTKHIEGSKHDIEQYLAQCTLSNRDFCSIRKIPTKKLKNLRSLISLL